MGVASRQRLKEYADAVASPAPAPGGGSVAAVCGSLAAALARMVAGIALGRKQTGAARKELLRICEKSESLQDRLLKLAEEDSRAFNAVMKALSLPRATSSQKKRRSAALQTALMMATEVPMRTMDACLEVIKVSRLAIEKGSKEAFTDAGCAALIADAALRSAGLNVTVNLMSIRNAGFRRRTESEMKTILRTADAFRDKMKRLVEARFQGA